MRKATCSGIAKTRYGWEAARNQDFSDHVLQQVVLCLIVIFVNEPVGVSWRRSCVKRVSASDFYNFQQPLPNKDSANSKMNSAGVDDLMLSLLVLDYLFGKWRFLFFLV